MERIGSSTSSWNRALSSLRKNTKTRPHRFTHEPLDRGSRGPVRAWNSIGFGPLLPCRGHLSKLSVEPPQDSDDFPQDLHIGSDDGIIVGILGLQPYVI